MPRNILGVIVGNRGFFPDSVARDGREEILRLLEEEEFDAVCLTPAQSKFGTVETFTDAKACAQLFAQHRAKIDGVLVTLPNFGDERGVANAIRISGLNVPVLVHAFPDDLDRFQIGQRRDAFCGKLSVCANLRQYRIPFSLTEQHTIAPDSPVFRAELRRFGTTCRVVRGLRNARFGAIGARPATFTSVRYSEKLLEDASISIEVIDLSELLARANRLQDSDAKVAAKRSALETYVNTQHVPPAVVSRMARFGVAVDDWIAENDLLGTAIQCWTSLQESFGIVPCTLMSMMGQSLKPSACEVDVTGVIGMYILQLASGLPSAIVDWNNNYAGELDKCVVYHCGNFPKEFFAGEPLIDTHEILAGAVPRENSWGTLQGRMKPGPATFLRVSTEDARGRVAAYVAEGEVTADPASTWGALGVVRVPQLQRLMRYVCRNGFEHHVCMSLSHVGEGIEDALATYLGWDVHTHELGGTGHDRQADEACAAAR